MAVWPSQYGEPNNVHSNNAKPWLWKLSQVTMPLHFHNPKYILV
jgi:hypothetical protein